MPRDTRVLEFLQAWYKSQSNGEWEKIKGVTIETMGTPGWSVTIDLSETLFDGRPMEPLRLNNSATDWMDCRIENKQFLGSGDSSKLVPILAHFQKWVKGASPSRRLKPPA
jgi:hypothetical protein